MTRRREKTPSSNSIGSVRPRTPPQSFFCEDVMKGMMIMKKPTISERMRRHHQLKKHEGKRKRGEQRRKKE